MHSTRCSRLALAAACAGMLAGCALKAPPSTADLRRDALPHTPVPTNWQATKASPAPLASAWLATFDDPALPALVTEALNYNADLQVAAARVEQAAGLVKIASGSLLPTLGLTGIYSGKSGGGGGLNAAFLSAALELDVWGRLRYGRATAQEQSGAIEADYAYARQSLAALVVKGWFIAIEAGLQRGLADEALRSAQELQRLAGERLRVGVGDEQAVAEAQANVGTYQDTVRQLEQFREQAVRALELLLGRYPGAEIAVAEHLAPVPAPVSVGVPAELLERRPDVIAADRRVAAAFNRVGEAKAAQLPRISLTAGGSVLSSDLFLLKDRNNPAWSFGGNLFVPIYQGGTLRAQVEIRTAEQKQAVAEYARIAQRSFGDVENALAAESALSDRDAILGRNIANSERALELAQVQYRVGNADLRVVEQRQLALYAARASRLRVQTERLAQRTNLYLALGGSFEQDTSVP